MRGDFKDIHTTLSKELWLQAMIHNLRWSEALEIGIRVALGIVKTEEEDLQEKINHTKGTLAAMELELNKLQQEKAKNQKKEAEEEYKRIRKEAQAFRRINPLRYD